MLVRGESVWAVPIGRYVELRRSKKPPRLVTTTFEKESTLKVPEYYIDSLNRERLRWVTIPRKLSFNNTIHTGGRVLKTVSLSRFYTVTRRVLDKEPMKLTKTQTMKLLSEA